MSISPNLYSLCDPNLHLYICNQSLKVGGEGKQGELYHRPRVWSLGGQRFASLHHHHDYDIVGIVSSSTWSLEDREMMVWKLLLLASIIAPSNIIIITLAHGLVLY